MKPVVRTLFIVLANIVLLAALLELAGNVFYFWQTGHFFYTSRRASAEPGSTETTNPFMTGDVHAAIHPYFGFVYKPNVDMATRLPHVTFNNHGFLQSSDYVRRNKACCTYPSERSSPNEVIVGVFGGSVAASLAVRMQDDPTFTNALAAIPRFANRPIRILSFALGGHKQPQQLMILTYYLSLSQPFDLIINADGINELNSGVGLLLAGVDVGFPDYSLWQELTGFIERQTRQAHEPAALLANYHLLMRQHWSRRLPRCRTATCYSLTRLVQYWHATNAGDNLAPAPVGAATPSHFFFQINPTEAGTRGAFHPADKNWDSAPRVIELVADHWATTSSIMQAIARSKNILYIHALQPNPWFRRSIPYVPRAPAEAMEYQRRIVPMGYAAFVAKGRFLRERGVNFIDASAILDDEPNSIYSDDVGHYTPRGYDLLAAAIARALAAPDLQ